jgi:hypothetical protein
LAGGEWTGFVRPAPDRPERRLLGQVLVDGGFVSPGDLARALAEQNRTNELLGEVLVRLGLADSDEIAAVVAIQSDLASLESAVRAAAGVRRCLGELLVDARRITPEQLEEALAEQRQTGERLGGILVRRRALTENQLHAALAFQRAQGGERPSSVRFRLGEILVATGQITREHLEAVLAHQKLTGRNIGDLLMEAGAAQHRHIARGLRLQAKLVTAALVAVLSFADAGAAQEAIPAYRAQASSNMRIQVTATVLPQASLTVLYQERALNVTPEDVSRGYVDAAAASRVEVRENSPRGYLLVFEVAGVPESPVERVSVRGLGTEIEIGPGGGFVPRPHARGPVSTELSYRFSLSRDARPGIYPWPLYVSVRPL